MQWSALCASGALVLYWTTFQLATLKAPNNRLRRRCLNMSSRQFKAIFRFTKREVDTILPHLQLPAMIKTKARDVCTAKHAFLCTLAYLGGSSLIRIEQLFGRSYTSVHRIVKATIRLILGQWSHLIHFRQAQELHLRPERLSQLANALAAFGCPSKQVWGFLDGTVRPIARPKRGQRSFYNGHKRTHAIKFQFLTTPDGLVWVDGPFRGPRHDSTMLKSTRLHQWLEDHSMRPNGRKLYIFADKGYAARGQLMVPYKGNTTDAQRRYNVAMSRIRVEVEHAIGWVTKTFPRFESKRSQRILLSPLGKEYKVAIILVNALSCLSGNQTSVRIGCDPPSLESYFVQVPSA
ncbi:hypothetical protein CF319_g8221 [Tilletia indica]|nr:hypothetical protein CF319_g8221 [Tilletia indica]